MNDDLLAQVREMRERGNAPKQIAKALGLRPAEVTPLIRQAAALAQSKADPADRALLGCWINQGWSTGLGLDDAPEWAAADPLTDPEPGTGGLAAILMARQERGSRATVCGFLLDVYCLGVKNAIGPVSMPSSAVDDFRRKFFSGHSEPPVTIPIDLAQNLVHGAAAYARDLGFEPHPDFTDTAPHLGTPATLTPIRFGRDGKPFYVSGPYDNPQSVVRTLEATAGPGNYDYIAHV
ncbi:hypothetical protein JOF56_004070 [Kibdelosporangium banguiense]|uniref:Helix-turn-helix domain-containing protein n=1 Tax=Kibdelosporangium banguiense TaxID=1365924 RepID=A0ABS4TGX6_9PSEU|nr:helix-turn-helix domain-containing protein [Kibdelosporangium banguiense]MBP2323685.1 hypothetical protein [Kibdelosporangium banguiense]